MLKRIISFIILAVMLFSMPVIAESTTTIEQTYDEQTVIEQPGELTSIVDENDTSLEPLTIANPVKAYLVVATKSYGAPDPSTGYVQETVSANTNIWVVEKIWCDYNDRYYYYAGYTYNGASHRGYFCEDNVYRNNAKYAPDTVANETHPAYMKVHTSKAGTVYDGPATTYSQTGTVGAESIKLIRMENEYNFIEYTVSSTGKKKRGFLHYSKIQGEWATLSANAASGLNGKTFYIRNTSTKKYLSIATNSTAAGARMNQQAFTGEHRQIMKITYNSTGKYYYIQPVSCYGEIEENDADRRLGIRTTQELHPDRHVIINTFSTETAQRFWIVKREGTPGKYKIVPVSSYGTMTIANRSGNYVNQYYTSTGTADTDNDIWEFETTKKMTSATRYQQEYDMWCWVAAARMAASSEETFFSSITQSYAVETVKGKIVNEAGTLQESALAANFFRDANMNSGSFKALEGKIYSESQMLKFIADNHTLILSLQYQTQSIGHSIVLIGFEWEDSRDSYDAPGSYKFYYYDPWFDVTDKQIAYYETFVGPSHLISTDSLTIWNGTVARETSYVDDTENYEEGGVQV